jgi:hypothetical protein
MVENITREQAICIFFCQEYTEPNVKELLEKMESFEDVDICYDEDPFEPKLLCNKRIDSEPLKYRRYNSSSLPLKTLN